MDEAATTEVKVCVVTGVGPGNGAAITRRFARGGYRVAMLARSPERLAALESEIEGARGFACDVTDAASVKAAFGAVREELGPVNVLVHNAGTGAFKRFEETTVADLEGAFATNVYGLLLCGQQAVPEMRIAGGGSVVVIGATASLRGGARFAAFAPAKGAQRLLAQSMARSLWPDGIHVAYAVIDGVVDTSRAREWLKDKPDDFFMVPDDIAESVWNLAHQPRSAWSFEVDLRPFGERW